MSKRGTLPKMGASGKLAKYTASKDAGGAEPEAPAAPDAAAAPAPKPEMKKLTLSLKKDAWRQLRMLGLEQDKSGQVLLVEAVNLLFKEYAKPQVA